MNMFRHDRFRRDWYGHLTNQGAHGGLVGLGAALLALAALSPLWAWRVAGAGLPASYDVGA